MSDISNTVEIEVSDDLYRAAEQAAERSGLSVDKQIEQWARLGMMVESMVRLESVAGLEGQALSDFVQSLKDQFGLK